MFRRVYSTTGSSRCSSTSSTNARSERLVEPLEVLAEGDRTQVLVRVVGLDPHLLEPGPDVDPAAAGEPLRGLLRAGEVPRPGPAGQRRRERLPLPHQLGRCLQRGDVAGAAALGDEAAAGHEQVEQPREQPLVVGDPVEGRGREDRVDRPVELKLQQIGDAQLGGVAQPLARGLDHRRRAVDRHHLAARQALEQRGGHPSGAAAGVENTLVAAEVEPVEHLASHRFERRRHPLVGRRVPVTGRHTTVRYREQRDRARIFGHVDLYCPGGCPGSSPPSVPT